MPVLFRNVLLATAAASCLVVPGGHLLGSSATANPDTSATSATAAVRFRVSVTNLTRAQMFSPPVVAVHTTGMTPLFALGQPASAEVAGVAEDALNMPLMQKLLADPNVGDVQVITGAGGPIIPGETASMIVSGTGAFGSLSLISMLVQTNDAFVALNGVELTRNTQNLLALAYDAGSEVNTENCAHIPGPPCNNPGVRVTQGAEGYVRIHEGMHGVGSLAANVYDWRNPVALVRIERID